MTNMGVIPENDDLQASIEPKAPHTGTPIAQAAASIQTEPIDVQSNRTMFQQLLKKRTTPGTVDPEAVRMLAEFVLGSLPGSGDFMSLQESQRSGQRMKEAFDQGDYGSAFGHLLESLGHGIAVLPMIPGMVKVYHGSRHSGIQKFDSSKIGTGEGAQAFGYGHYFAEDPGIAGHYKRAGGVDPSSELLTVFNNFSDDEYVGAEITRIMRELNQQGAQGAIPQARWDKAGAEMVKALRSHPEDYVKKTGDKLEADLNQKGELYNVELDVNHEDLLDWDVPLSRQNPRIAKIVQSSPLFKKIKSLSAEEMGADIEMAIDDAAEVGLKMPVLYGELDKVMDDFIGGNTDKGITRLEKAIKTHFARKPDGLSPAQSEAYDELKNQLTNVDMDLALIKKGDLTGHQVYMALSDSTSPEEAAKALHDLGIPGIRYLDNPSRGRGEGTRNIVMFPGTEDKIKIVQEKVDQAALKYKGKTYLGVNHTDAADKAAEEYGVELEDVINDLGDDWEKSFGFQSTHGRFLDAKEALKIAYEQDQGRVRSFAQSQDVPERPGSMGLTSEWLLDPREWDMDADIPVRRTKPLGREESLAEDIQKRGDVLVFNIGSDDRDIYLRDLSVLGSVPPHGATKLDDEAVAEIKKAIIPDFKFDSIYATEDEKLYFVLGKHKDAAIRQLTDVEKSVDDVAKEFINEGETIVSSAIKVDDKIHTGVNHAEIADNIGILENEMDQEGLDVVSGFVTSEGRFVDREEALQIAGRSGQADPTYRGGLYQEDLDFPKDPPQKRNK